MAGHHLCVVEIGDVPDSSLRNKELIGNTSNASSGIIVAEIYQKISSRIPQVVCH